ncbi:MAG: DUF1573 domain-containing protein [Verrucomicrobiota bacterium]
MKALLLTTTVITVSILSATARADLKWDKTTIEVRTGPNDQMAVAHFKYQNVGSSPVRFKEVKPACGCTTVQTQQDSVPVGEKGEITARLNIGDRTGAQEKTVTVETDDPMNPTTVLTIKAFIPQPFDVQPTFLFWQGGEAAKPKTITVRVLKEWEFPVRGIKANSSSWDFQTKIEKISKDEFKVEVLPEDTSRAISGTITIQPEDSTRKYVANLRVMGSGAATDLISNPSNPSTQGSEELLKNPFDEPAANSSPSP